MQLMSVPVTQSVCHTIRETFSLMAELEWEHKPQTVIKLVEVPALQPGQLEKLSEQSSLSLYQPCAPPSARVQRGSCQ